LSRSDPQDGSVVEIAYGGFHAIWARGGPGMAEVASRRARELILQLPGRNCWAGSWMCTGETRGEEDTVTRARFARDADVPVQEVEQILGALGFAPLAWTRTAARRLIAGGWMAPAGAAEVEREMIDREIARLYGLDKFSAPAFAARQGSPVPQYEAETRLRDVIGLGYREIVTIPHVHEQRDVLFRPAGACRAAPNPLRKKPGLRSTGSVTMGG